MPVIYSFNLMSLLRELAKMGKPNESEIGTPGEASTIKNTRQIAPILVRGSVITITREKYVRYKFES